MLHDAHMRLNRFYSQQPLPDHGTVELGEAAARHIYQVLRMQPDEALVVFDGSGREFAATIISATKQRVEIELGQSTEPATESPVHIVLWHGLCRGSRMDNVVQKATELGVAEIQPVNTEFGVVRLNAARGQKKAAHWQQVAISACEQSGRVRIPQIHPPQKLAAAFDTVSSESQQSASYIMFDPEGQPELAHIPSTASKIVILTGPEGGFSPAEKAAAQNAGFTLASLGPRVLRTETAPVVALGLVQHLTGDLN
jgi:16S rRNA (uracil1498-N3)-methyltransferase